MKLTLPEDTGGRIANLIILSSASLVSLNPTLVVSATFPIILQYAPELLGEFAKSAVFGEAWNALKRKFGRRKRKGEVSDQEVLESLRSLKDNEGGLKELVSEIQDTLEELTREKEDFALKMVETFKDLISQEEFKKQISTDIAEGLQEGLNTYLEELASRVSEENKRELKKLGEEIFLSLQTIARKDLKELRENKDLEEPIVNIISDRILVRSEYLRTVAEEVISKVQGKRLIFVVGEAGVGKSKLLYLIWKKLKEKEEDVAYLLNLRETPFYHGVLFYDDFKSDLFDPSVFPALTTRKLVITIRDFEYERLRSNMEFKKLEDRGAFFHVYLNKEKLKGEFLVELANKYLEEKGLKTSKEIVAKIIAKSEGLPIYITTLIEHCAYSCVKIEEIIERVPSGIFKLIGEILYSSFYKPPTKEREAEVEVWTLSTLVALAHWQGLMHERHLEVLMRELRNRLKKLDDSVKFYDLSNYEYLLKKVGNFYGFKHWTWIFVISAVYDGKLEEFRDLKHDLGKIQKYLRYSELDFDALLKTSYFKALEGSKSEEKLDLFTGYLFSHSSFFSDLEMYAEVVERLEGVYEKSKTSEIAVMLASGLVNLINALGTSGELKKAEEKEEILKELYKDHETQEIAVLFAKGLYNLITDFGKSGELKKAEEKELILNEVYESHKKYEIAILFAKGLVNLIAFFSKSGELKKAEEKEKKLKELCEDHGTPEIAAELAGGLTNLIAFFSKSGELKKAEEKEKRLNELYEAYETPEIAVEFAKGLYNLITYFGEGGELEKAEEKEEILKGLYKHHETQEIAVVYAKGLYNLTTDFGKSGDLKKAEEIEEKLNEIYKHHKKPEIAIWFAKGFANLIAFFGESGELKKAEEKEARLNELYENHRTPEITVELANGLYRLILAFKRRNEIDKCWNYCDELSELSMQHEFLEILEIYTKALNLISRI